VKKSESGFSRLFLIIISGIAFALVTGYMWGFQTAMWWKFRHDFTKKAPILNLIPQVLPNIAATSTKSTKLSYAGFEFEVPWTDLDSQESKFIRNTAVYRFQSGRALMFFGPSPTQEDLLSEVEKDFGDKQGNLVKLFGPEATKSNYAFHKAFLEETSARLKPWMSKRDAVRCGMLLTIKAVSSVGGETGIFKVQANGWKGFQFDDPSKKPKRTTLELYDSQDQHVEIIFMGKNEAGVDITQGDINRVLETLRPAERLTASKISVQDNPKGPN